LTEAEEGRLSHHYLDWSVKGKSALWRYAIAIVAGFVLWQFGSSVIMVLMAILTPGVQLDGPFFTYTFLAGLLAIFFLVRLILGRPWYSVAVFSAEDARLSDYVVGLLAGWSASVLTYLTLIDRDRFTYRGWGAEWSSGAVAILAMALGYAIQTAFEEIYFRGLIAQATRRLTRWIPVVIGVQAWLFASLHVGNIDAWGHGNLAALPYLVVALQLGWVAWRTGSLLMPMGLHFANNSFLAFAVNTKGDVVHSFAPFVVETPTLGHTIWFELARSLVIVLAVEVWIAWRKKRAAPING
jgi:membrane protease YdiL (CAAX protease family)